MDDHERLEKLEALIEELRQRSEEGAVIIVEGQRDRRALRELGINGAIRLGAQKSLLELCEEVAGEYENVIILTDWDENGEKLAGLMEGFLRDYGATINVNIRENIQHLVQKRIKDIESLNTHISNLKSELKILYE